MKTNMLDSILAELIDNVEESKDKIFFIVEQNHNEYEKLSLELDQLKIDIYQSIHKRNQLEGETKIARNFLGVVKKNFNNYSEKEVEQAYNQAYTLQQQLLTLEGKEKQMSKRRNDIERRLLILKDTIEYAEQLISTVSTILNFLEDDMKQVGAALADAKTKQLFALKIMTSQEEERKKLSKEIHDGPTQMLANVLLRSDIIERFILQGKDNHALNEINHMKEMVRYTLNEVRKIIYDLRPMALDDLGIIPTLTKYLNKLSRELKNNAQNTCITFTHLGLDDRLSSNMETVIFRLVQECVQNAIKHAHARNIDVRVEISKDRIITVVKDDGIGFDVNSSAEEQFGILGLKERTDLLNGIITIDSKLNKGTSILISVPIH